MCIHSLLLKCILTNMISTIYHTAPHLTISSLELSSYILSRKYVQFKKDALDPSSGCRGIETSKH